jgi:hypothetical protein
VDELHHWPGPDVLAALLLGVPLTATKPARFFRPDGDLPASVTLPLARPPGFEHFSHDDFAALLRCRTDQAHAVARRERLERGLPVLGRRAILRQHWNDRPTSREPRRRLSPRVACRDKWRRIEILRRNKTWLDAYHATRARWLAGDGTATFPPGVWWLARFAGVRCAPPPPPS